jgi:UDP-N-acetyl-D-glucosamine dehydrogenase
MSGKSLKPLRPSLSLYALHPEPGLGGIVIVDPYYLAWKARMSGFEPVDRTGCHHKQPNARLPLTGIADALNKRKKSMNGSHVLALGIAYKSDVNDTRESAALEVVRLLMEEGKRFVFRPLCPKSKSGDLVSVNLTSQLLKSMDCVVILTDHSVFDYPMIASDSPLVLDCRIL